VSKPQGAAKLHDFLAKQEPGALSNLANVIGEPVPPKVEAPYADFFAKLRRVKVNDVDGGELATSAVNDLYVSVSGIKDEANAQAALAGLNKGVLRM
jgi:hypothetical protein